MGDGGHNGHGTVPIGGILERTRQERGLSLRDVEDATKIRTRYLDGLEREDLSVLPDAIYVQGFLKTYANFLGLDGEGLAREFKNNRSPRRDRQFNYERPRDSEFEQPIISPGGLSGTERRRVSGAAIFTVALAVLVLVLVIGALYYIGVQSAGSPGGGSPGNPEAPNEPPSAQEPAEDRAEEEPEKKPAPRDEQAQSQAPAREEPRESPSEASPPETPPEEPAVEEISVTVRVPQVPTGLTISADGEVVSSVFAQPGFEQTFAASDAIVVEATNGGVVTVVVDGVDQGYLGYYGQPVTRTFGRYSGG